MVDVREAARIAGRTPETVRRWVWSGRIAARKQGGRLLLARHEVVGLARGAAHAGGGDAEPSLADWTALVTSQRRGTAGRTAAGLVLDDRAGR